MKHPLSSNRLWLAAVALLAAGLACYAPSAQQQQTQEVTQTQEVAQASEPAQATSPATEAPAGVTPSATTGAPPPAGVTPSATTCLYNSVFVSDLTIPDGTEIQTNNTFTKTWRIKNNGCQKWVNVTLIFVSGNQMSGPASVPVPDTVPGGTADVSVNLKAPNTPGTYQGYWQLRNADGIQFGDKVFVQIKAVAPAPPTDTSVPPTATSPIIILPPPVILLVDYTASYVGGVWNCHSGGTTLYMYTAIVKNTGPVVLQSLSWSLQSPAGTVLNNGNSNARFQTTPTSADCNAPALQGDSLAVGATGWVSGFVPTTPIPGGSAARLWLKLCSEENQAGACKAVNIDFTS